MKKTLGISLLSAMLILGQPIMAYANTINTINTINTTDSKIINFKEIGNIIAKNNLQVRINENDRLESSVGLSGLKRDIKDIEKRLEDINDELGDSTEISHRIALGAEKRGLLANLKILERNLEDMPTSVNSTDVAATMSDDVQIRLAESAFIMHNKLDLAVLDISISINTLKNQLEVMQVRERLGIVTHTNVDDLKTKLVDLQTKLESTNLQQDLAERQLKDLLNDHDDSLEIGQIPISEASFIIRDQDADVKKAKENSYTIKLQEEKIVILKSTLARAKKDNGLSSDEYLHANYQLSNAKLVLSQQKDKLNSDYYTILEDIAKKQSNLRLEEQKLEDKKVALSEANLKMSLGVITQLDLESAITEYQLQGDVVQTNKIDLFTSINSYDWFLKGMPYTA